MIPKINRTQTPAWKKLADHYSEMKTVRMKTLFDTDAARFDKMSIQFNELIFDYSKNRITDETKQYLLELAAACDLKPAIEAMFNGEKINETENRAVLHTALRNFSDTPIMLDGADVMPEIKKVRQQMKSFCEKIHQGEWKGYTGKKIKNIVNIGIGGCDLGPVMVT
tara:strand:+ start:24043 stop:24543 length:501 start_codon:yes stop_codon:yes gene_type:complete